MPDLNPLTIFRLRTSKFLGAAALILFALFTLFALFGVAPSFAEDEPDPGAEDPQISALAEQLVNAPNNRDKVQKVAGKTSELKVSLLRIERKQTGIQGKAQPVQGKKLSIQEQLLKIGAQELPTEIKIILPGSVLFAFDRSDLRPDAVDTLDRLAALLKDFGTSPVRIEGHTDWMGTDEYNQALSLRRANAVTTWLQGHGVAGGRIKVQGFGESRPVATNETDDGRQQNRRVEVIIEKTSKK